MLRVSLIEEQETAAKARDLRRIKVAQSKQSRYGEVADVGHGDKSLVSLTWLR